MAPTVLQDDSGPSTQLSAQNEVPAHLNIPQLADFVIDFNPFEIGGQGKIYRAQRKTDGKPVAIKIMERTHCYVMTSFTEESKALLLLRNKANIMNLVMAHHNINYTYLVTEYINGFTLGEISLRNKKISFRAIQETLRQLCVAIDTIHNMAIIHSDISPDNIMINHNGVLKLIDFGLCQITSHKTEKVTYNVGWYCNYPAPEMDLDPLFDYKVDLYASAVSMTSLFTRWVPAHLIKSILLVVQDRCSIAYLFGIFFKILQKKKCSAKIITVLKSWSEFEPKKRIDPNILLSNNHFPNQMATELYINEIFDVNCTYEN